MAKQVSNPDRILQAAVGVCKGSQRAMRAGEIVVAAWSDYPAEFGLADSELSHPDAPKIMDGITNKRNGLLASGFFERKDNKFVVTKSGRERAKELAKPLSKQAFTADCARFLSGLLASEAYKKMTDNQSDKVSREDGLAFLGITERTKDIEVVLGSHAKFLDEIEVKVDEAGEGGSIECASIKVDAGMVRFLRNVSSVCKRKCEKHLARMGVDV